MRALYHKHKYNNHRIEALKWHPVQPLLGQRVHRLIKSPFHTLKKNISRDEENNSISLKKQNRRISKGDPSVEFIQDIAFEKSHLPLISH